MGNDAIFKMIDRWNDLKPNQNKSPDEIPNETPKDYIDNLLTNHIKMKNILSHIAALFGYLIIATFLMIIASNMFKLNFKIRILSLPSLVIHILICIILIIISEIIVDVNKSLMCNEIKEHGLIDLPLAYKECLMCAVVNKEDKVYYINQIRKGVFPKVEITTKPPFISHKILKFMENQNLENKEVA